MSTWVLLRGLARESRHWGSFPGVLKAHLPEGCEVLALDLPGNGVKCRESSPSSVASMVDAYRDELQALAVHGPVVLLGLSLGAMVAAQWAHWLPGEIAGCMLVNGSSAGLVPPWKRLLPGALAALARATLLSPDPLERERTILGLCSNQPEAPVAAQWAAFAMQSPTSPANALRQLLAAARFRLPARPCGVGVVVVSSARDRLVSPQAHAAIATWWRAPLVVHPHAGHELSLDAPHWLARQCAGFEQSIAQQHCHRFDARMP